jgi:hypothetical protein
MFQSPRRKTGLICFLLMLSFSTRWPAKRTAGSEDNSPDVYSITGLTGQISNVRVSTPATLQIEPLRESQHPADIDIKRMAQRARNYLINTPRKELNCAPLFHGHPLRCPPIPTHADPVVSCATDARMDWEWYFMREIAGFQEGLEVAATFHRRMRDYDANGFVFSSPGAHHEGHIDRVWTKEEYIMHTWGPTTIRKSPAEDCSRTKDLRSTELARKVFFGRNKLVASDANGRCWFPQGMGGCKADGTVVPNNWVKKGTGTMRYHDFRGKPPTAHRASPLFSPADPAQ